jgi:hypothetical protein
MRRQWCRLKMASARPARPTRDQATAVRPLVEASYLLTVALAHRERRVPARAIVRRMDTQPTCRLLAVPVRRVRLVRVLAIAGADDGWVRPSQTI